MRTSAELRVQSGGYKKGLVGKYPCLDANVVRLALLVSRRCPRRSHARVPVDFMPSRPSLCVRLAERKEAQELRTQTDKERSTAVERDAAASRLRAARPRPVTCSQAGLRCEQAGRGREEGGRRLLVSGRSCMGVWRPEGALYPGPRM